MTKQIHVTPETFHSWSLDPVVDELLASEPVAREGRTSQTLVKTELLTVVLVVIRAGGGMKEHRAPSTAMVVPLRGEVEFAHAGQTRSVRGAEPLTMGAGLSHSVTAKTDSAFLLIFGYPHPEHAAL